MKPTSKIFVAGASGMVGSAIIRALIKAGYTNIIGSYHSRKPDAALLLPEGFNIIDYDSEVFTLHASRLTIHDHHELRLTPYDSRLSCITPDDSRPSRLTSHALRLTKTDLTDQSAVHSFFAEHQPDHVFLAAAKVGGIHANNTYPAEFIFQNMMIEANVIHAAHKFDVKRLLFLGSSCIYPRQAPQPMKEETLLTGPLEPTNEPYALAKIAGIKLCESYNRQYGRDFRSVMPTNLYGPGDNYDLENSHVIPALLRKMHLGKLAEQGDVLAIERDEQRFGTIPDEILKDLGLERKTPTAKAQSTQSEDSSQRSLRLCGDKPFVRVWGSGTPKREFLHVDDMASACVHVMILDRKTYQSHTQPMLSHINVGTGTDCTIKKLAQTIARVVDYRGEIAWDSNKPDGTPRKLLDVTRMNELGWKAGIGLEDGLARAYAVYMGKDQT